MGKKDDILEQFEELPPEAQKQVADFVKFLFDQYGKSETRQILDKPLADSPFVGMWKDRTDMQNSTDWVKKQRRDQWSR